MKSTVQTSRKIYAMKASFVMLSFLIVTYALLNAFGDKPSELVFSAAIGAIGAIVTALNIADGMKKGDES